VRTAATYQVDKMFVPIVTLGILGITLTALLRVLERRVAPWTLRASRIDRTGSAAMLAPRARQ
jgi:ABC-type nitrate/sulfonate/bicarbonate transport system permease component